MIGKKADWFMDNWAEFFALVLLIVGFIVGISAGSAVILYIISVLFGAAFGRWWFRFKKKLKIPASIITIGALIGLTLGSFYGDRKIVILLFVAGFAASYYLHERKIIHSAEY
ncbi:hypothetical protein JW707_04940 [Candidatus Woesearchaeota archaeon]|nr:hypothetical protein [Candidatus Woesearchaeota archaeon]